MCMCEDAKCRMPKSDDAKQVQSAARLRSIYTLLDDGDHAIITDLDFLLAVPHTALAKLTFQTLNIAHFAVAWHACPQTARAIFTLALLGADRADEREQTVVRGTLLKQD